MTIEHGSYAAAYEGRIDNPDHAEEALRHLREARTEQLIEIAATAPDRSASVKKVLEFVEDPKEYEPVIPNER